MKGLIHIYTGEGKGKTTAALGLAARAAGHGKKVQIIQFLKPPSFSGEHLSMTSITGLEIESYGVAGPVKKSDDNQAHVKLGIKKARSYIKNTSIDMLVLDEINIALNLGFVKLAEVMKLIEAKHDNMELVLTGRDAHPEVIKKADYVTEMKELKHPYNKGIAARKGVEY